MTIEMKNIEVPNFLYKYFGNSEHAYYAMRNQCIHFERASSYNDVFDASVSIDKTELLSAKCNASVIKEISKSMSFEYRDISSVLNCV